MKSPEDNIDDGLREALRRRFEDFEIKPEPELKRNIFTAIKVWQSDRNFQRNWIIFLSLAILFTGTLFYRSVHTSVAKEGPATVRLNTGQVSENLKSAIQVGGETEINKGGSFDRKITRGKLVHPRHIDAPGEVNVKFRSVPEPDRMPKAHYENEQEDIDIEIIVDDNETIEPGAPRTAEDDIALLNILPPRFESHAMPVPEITARESAISEKSGGTDRGWTILAGVTPVKTFQVLNVISNPGLIYRNFQFPGSASVETLGYKLNAGVAKNGFAFLLSYSQYRQSVSYEKAGNEFEIIPGGTNNAEVRRKFTTVTSDRVLRLAGIGVRKEFVPKTPAFRDFYAVLGSEFSAELSEGKSMLWLNAGIGRQVGISRNATLQIGPYFEYGFTKLLNAEGAFHVKPYQVGLSVILKNRLNK